MKKSRHEKIIELISRQEVETQEMLAALLNESGYKVTQATVSRDIRALALTKVVGANGRQHYVMGEKVSAKMQDKFTRVLQNSLISIERAENLVVIRTFSGMAMAAGAAIDALRMPEVAGCIAGDDTIFVAVRTKEETSHVTERLKELSGVS